MCFLFWFSALLLFYIYLGYPLLIWMWAKVRPRPFRRGEAQGTASVILAAYNEAHRLPAKVASLRAADPSCRMLEILIGSDGSSDETAQVVRALADPLVRLLEFPERRGKPSVLNDLASVARGDFLLFTDARQDIAAGAVEELLAGFEDSKVGVISGELVFRRKGSVSVAAEGMGAYWQYEKWIRRNEAMVHSVPGATGAFYAMRRALYRPLPSDALLDDVLLPMQAVKQGARCVFEPMAVVFDEPSASAGRESIRKRRTIAGCFQILRLHPQWLLPGGHPIWLQYVSHKVFRLASPWLLLLVLLASILLVDRPFYAVVLWVQAAFYALALGGWWGQHRGKTVPRWLGIPVMFLVLQIETVRAAWDALRGRYSVKWALSTPGDAGTGATAGR